MQAHRPTRGRGASRARGPLVAGALIVAVILVVLAALGNDLLGAVAGPGATPTSSATGSGVAPASGHAEAPGSPAGSGSPSGSSSAAASSAAASTSSSALATGQAGATSSPAATPSPAATGTPVVPGGPSPAASPDASGALAEAAPTSARGFRPTATVVPMGLPFRPVTRFTYGAGFRSPRDGIVYPYNLIRGVAKDGTLLRAHDGQDLLVPLGTLVVAPFSGVVVDPAATWRPWDPQRYGKVVAIRSTEPTSPGYTVILVHLSRQSVPIGAIVRRGQVVGRTGRSGNALETVPHLHIEIRAPFEIRYGYGGVIRLVDVFDILPSLRAAAGTGS